jgi:hypothetical protein
MIAVVSAIANAIAAIAYAFPVDVVWGGRLIPPHFYYEFLN